MAKLSAQDTLSKEQYRPVFRHAVSGYTNLGIDNRGPYLGFFGQTGYRYDYFFHKNLSISTGIHLMLGAFGGSIGVPLNLQTGVVFPRGGAFLVSAGIIVQHGGQPALWPNMDMRCRIGLGRRWYLEMNAAGYLSNRYKCWNGSYSCNQPTINDGTAGNIGAGLGIGRFWGR